MMRQTILAFATLIALNQAATAGVLFGHVSCAVVRFYVARYSEVAAEKWARTHGATDAEIETARRCLHSANVQTASLAVKSQAPVTEQERAQHETAKPDPGQDAAHVTVVSVQDQRADLKQDHHKNESGLRGVIAPKDIDVGHVSHENKDLSRSDGRATPLRSRYVGVVHRERSRVTGVSWLKRLWHHLTRGRQFRVAVLHFGGDRR
jgi:hypothetical protein